jgi:hypothetical protein
LAALDRVPHRRHRYPLFRFHLLGIRDQDARPS